MGLATVRGPLTLSSSCPSRTSRAASCRHLTALSVVGVCTEKCVGPKPQQYVFHLSDETCAINDPNGPFYDEVNPCTDSRASRPSPALTRRHTAPHRYTECITTFTKITWLSHRLRWDRAVVLTGGIGSPETFCTGHAFQWQYGTTNGIGSKICSFYDGMRLYTNARVARYDAVAIFSGSTTIVDGKPVIVYPGLCNKTNCPHGSTYAVAVPADPSDPTYTNWSKPSCGQFLSR